MPPAANELSGIAPDDYLRAAAAAAGAAVQDLIRKLRDCFFLILGFAGPLWIRGSLW